MSGDIAKLRLNNQPDKMQIHPGAEAQPGGLQARRRGESLPKTNLPVQSDNSWSAYLVGDFESGSPAWHELRKSGIGGSDIAAICNASPWTSPFALWAIKSGRIEDNYVPSEAAEWGTRLEAVVLDKFAEEHPELTIYPSPGTWANKDRPWQLANPDAIYQTADGQWGIVEIKTSRYADDWVDGVPAYYRTQIQWYAQTFDFTAPSYCAALFTGSDYREYVLEHDQFEQDTNLQRVEEFRKYLETDTQPDYDGSTSTLDTVRALHPDIEDDGVELGDLGMHYQLAVTEAAQAQAHLNEMKSRVLDAMGNAKRGLLNDTLIVTRQSKNGGAPYLVNKKKA